MVKTNKKVQQPKNKIQFSLIFRVKRGTHLATNRNWFLLAICYHTLRTTMRFYCFVILLTLFACSSKQHKTVIQGKILGNVPEIINYTNPIDGLNFWGFQESIKPDSAGNFYIEFTISEPLFVNLSIPNETGRTFLFEPSENYVVDFDLRGEKKVVNISSYSKVGQDLIDKFHVGFVESQARKLVNEPDLSKIVKTIQETKNKELSDFTLQLNSNTISQGFYDLVKLDRDCYYSALQGEVARLKHYQAIRNKENVNKVLQMWSEVYGNIDINDTTLKYSPWFYYLTENYLRYKEKSSNRVTNEKLKQIFDQGTYHTYRIQEAKNYLSEPIQEYFVGEYLYFNSYQNRYEKELIDLITEFKADYPNSNYTKYLNPLQSSIVEYYEISENPFSDKIKFVDKFRTINSLKSLGQHLDEKKIFIDIWASWCNPCIQEFKFKDELKIALTKNGIGLLYLSIDSDDNDNKWKNLIKVYNLEGYHMRANSELSKYLSENFGNSGTLSIPHYIIIGKSGKVLIHDAPRPSELSELENKMKGL